MTFRGILLTLECNFSYLELFIVANLHNTYYVNAHYGYDTECNKFVVSVNKWKTQLQYTSIYSHERLWLKLLAQGDCNCVIFLRGEAPKDNSTIAVTEGPQF